MSRSLHEKAKRRKLEKFEKFEGRLKKLEKSGENEFMAFMKEVQDGLQNNIEKKVTADIGTILSTFNAETRFEDIMAKLKSVNKNLLWLGVFLSQFVDQAINEGLGTSLEAAFTNEENYKQFKNNLKISFYQAKAGSGTIGSLGINLRSDKTSKFSGQDILSVVTQGGEYDPIDATTKKMIFDAKKIGPDFINRYVMPNISKYVSETFFLDDSLANDLEKIIENKLNGIGIVEKGDNK